METVQSVRFYNAGDKVFERLIYSAAEFDKKNENGVRHYPLEAPENGFFDVPREIRTESGAAQLLGLPREIMEKYGPRGFVMIDRNYTDAQCESEPFVANSDEMAKTKGREVWLLDCLAKVREYEENNEKRKAMGLAAARPSGYIVHRYKVLGQVPPAAEEEKRAIEGKTTIEQLQEQVKLLTALVTAKQPDGEQKQPGGKRT